MPYTSPRLTWCRGLRPRAWQRHPSNASLNPRHVIRMRANVGGVQIGDHGDTAIIAYDVRSVVAGATTMIVLSNVSRIQELEWQTRADQLVGLYRPRVGALVRPVSCAVSALRLARSQPADIAASLRALRYSVG